MFCPNCQCEYVAGVTTCPDCDVALVEELEQAGASHSHTDSVVSIWTGNDPREFAAVKEALEKAQIPYMDPPSSGYLIFPSMRPKLEIGVSIADRERAEKVLEDLVLLDDAGELPPEDREKVALPEPDKDDGDDFTNVPDDLPEDWDDQEPVSEVWTGGDEEMASTLFICLREVGIPSHKYADAGRWRLVVPSGQEARAKEVVREVMEGGPPE